MKWFWGIFMAPGEKSINPPLTLIPALIRIIVTYIENRVCYKCNRNVTFKNQMTFEIFLWCLFWKFFYSCIFRQWRGRVTMWIFRHIYFFQFSHCTYRKISYMYFDCILTGPGHEESKICLPFTGASESVSPCFRFRITLLLGSPSSIKLVSYPVMSHNLWLISFESWRWGIICSKRTLFILFQHSLDVIIGRSPRCISIIWSFVSS